MTTLLNKDIQTFIKAHAHDDVAALALKTPPKKDWPYALILDQIKVRQKARLKTPALCTIDGFIFPPPFLYEQASSESCAAYKAQITKDFSGSFIDLTAGVGVDSFALLKNFSSGTLIEKDTRNAEILCHNACIISKGLDVREDDAKTYVQSMLEKTNKINLAYIDPQRRNKGCKGLYDLEKCSPNILELLPDLEQIAHAVLIKTAPFLDIDKALLQINEALGKDKQIRIDIHITQWQGDCKEVLYLLNFSAEPYPKGARLTAVDLDNDGNVHRNLSFFRGEEKNVRVHYAMPKIGDYIYEPGPAFQKSSGYGMIATKFDMPKLHPHTHLYLAKEEKDNFPGKHYRISGIFPVKPKVLPIQAADIAIRNFPQTVQTLRKKLRLRDGGSHRLYAVTTCDEKHNLILCSR